MRPDPTITDALRIDRDEGLGDIGQAEGAARATTAAARPAAVASEAMALVRRHGRGGQLTSRRAVLAGLAALTVSACAGPRPIPAAARPEDRPAAGFDGVIDLSHFNRVWDFAAARDVTGVRAVIHKASEGADWVDPLYGQRREAARAAGLLWGAYHFGTAQHPGAEQARAFLAAAQPGPDTLMALDLELNEHHPDNTMDLFHAEDFVRAVLAATGRLPLVYVRPDWADGKPLAGWRRTLGGAIGPGSILADCDLWLADYRGQPNLPAAWSRRGWHLWQYTGDRDGPASGPFRRAARAVAGVERCDRNLFPGEAAALAPFWSGYPSG